jgi:excisionase family DNA binding protein
MSVYLTVTDVAERIHKSRRWVSSAIRSGDLTASKLGRDYLIAEADFTEWLKRHRPTFHRSVEGISAGTVRRLRREQAARRVAS